VRNFQISIVSAVKIRKQCLQTASASGQLRPQESLPGLRRWTPMGNFRPQIPRAIPTQMKTPDAAITDKATIMSSASSMMARCRKLG